MAAPTTVPVTIAPEAAERVAELGRQHELELMIEHAKQTIPGLRSLEVELALPYDTGDETSIMIRAMMEHPNPLEDRTWDQWASWQIETFPPEVNQCLHLTTIHV